MAIVEGKDGEELKMQSGDIVVYDYRPPSSRTKRSKRQEKLPIPVTLKCIQWNIERGYKLDDVIRCLKSHRADIICLQEVDIGCERSDSRNCAREIAEALQVKCAYMVEFEELWDIRRPKHLQGGGTHGNAILSKFDLEPRVIEHKFHPVNWERDGEQINEPRRGKRRILAADVFVPGVKEPVLCYSLHLEVFCGIFGRIKQLADVFEDSKANLDRPRQFIFGDLNTLAHGIARLSSIYCRDSMRFNSLGWSEAAWWQRYILSYTNVNYPNPDLVKHVPANLHVDDVSRLLNPYFYDPFSPDTDTTLQSHYGLYTGKLDWTLLRGWHVLSKGMDNHHYQWSDHKLMYVIVRPVEVDESSELGEPDEFGKLCEPGEVAYKEYHDVPLDPPTRTLNAVTMVMAFGLTVGLVVASASRFLK